MTIDRTQHSWRQLLRAVVLLSAFTLPLGALATSAAACSSKTAAQKASALCGPKAKPGGASKSGAKAKATSKSSSKAGAKQASGKHAKRKGAGAPQDRAGIAAEQAATANLPMPKRLPPDAKPLLHTDSPCFTALGSSSASHHIAAKVPFFLDGEASAELLANPGRPGKLEKTELSSVLAGYEMCLDMASDWRRATYSQEASAVLDAYWQKSKTILGTLEAGKSSYGEAAKAINENDKAYKSRLDEVAPH